MVDTLLATVGLYGASLIVGFIAGMFPLVSIELFLVGVTRWGAEPGALVLLIALGAIGHQIAKSVTYYMGAGALELPKGKIRDKIDAAKHRVDRWNRYPRLIMFAGGAFGVPPLFVMGFIAQPLMRMSHATFTAVTFSARVLRLTTLVVAARLI